MAKNENENEIPEESESPEEGGGEVDVEETERQVVEVLKACYDPEIPVNIYELGLIYKIEIDPSGAATVDMTLTSPMCPVAGSLPPEVETKIRQVPGITASKVNVVWDPPWTPEKMTEAARLQLGLI